jgi:Ca-activated chloride channel family protein
MRTLHPLPGRSLRTASVLAAALLLGTACDISVSGRDQPATGGPTGSAPAPSPARPAGDPEPAGALLLVMDASGSMADQDAAGQTLLDGAKQALREVVQELPEGQPVGLRVYGHRVPNTDRENGCRDTELIHPISPLDRPALLEAIDGFDAVGYTPIGRSLQEAAEDLPPEGPRAIILVSDGEDTCAPPDPCGVAEELAGEGIELVIHTVGFALGGDDQARSELECIAEAARGEYHDADTAADLAETLTDVSTRETRRFQAAGLRLAGAPIPRDAATGALGTAHVDTVLGDETNFYRFEITPGSRIRAEVVLAGNPDAAGSLICVIASLTDAADEWYAIEIGIGGPPDETLVRHIAPVVVDASEVWLKIATDGCSLRQGPDAEFDVEFQVIVG